jgi:CheY-like chemotaxis protein
MQAQSMQVSSSINIAALVAHEVKNGNARVIAALELLREHPERLELIEAALAAANYVDSVVYPTLDLAKAGSGKSPLIEGKFSIAELLAFVLQTVEGAARTVRNVTFSVDCPDNMPLCHGDSQRLKQALINLVNNACKFTAEKFQSEGGLVTLRVRHLEGGDFRFSVEDNGPGMSPETQSALFDAFHQAPETASLGTGLGLAISLQYVTTMGGKIWADSELGKGTTFFVQVPLKVLAAETVQVSASAAVADANPSQVRILIIEDMAMIGNMLKSVYKRAGAQCDHVLTCAEARVSLETNQSYDLVLVDNVLPDGSGVTLVKEMRAAGKHRSAYIVGTTGYGEEQKEEFQAAGTDEVLLKPIHIPDACALLKRLPAKPPHMATSTVDSVEIVVKGRMLVVDDNSDEFLLLERRLRGLAECESAESCAEALARVEKSSFDLVIVDMKLNGERGTDIVSAIRKLQQLTMTRSYLVGMSGWPDDEAAFRDAGVDEYLAKTAESAPLIQLWHRAHAARSAAAA